MNQETVHREVDASPSAEATLILTDRSAQWRIRCPFCKRIHLHGAGGRFLGDTERRRYLGFRGAHCRDTKSPRPEYVLTWMCGKVINRHSVSRSY
jgi:hypothetical protein